MTFRVDKRLLYGVFGVLALALAFGIGLFFSGAFNDDQAAAPAQPAAPVAQAPAPQAQAPAQQPPAAEFTMATADRSGVPDASLDELFGGAELSDAQAAAVPRISVDEAAAKVGAEGVVWVDTRTAGEFEGGHVPGAISVPAYDGDAALRDLPEGQEIIVYCA